MHTNLRQTDAPRRAWRAAMPVVLVAAAVAGSVASGASTTAAASAPTIDTAAGTIGDGGPAANAYMSADRLFADASGNLYVTESHRVRKIAAATNVVTTIAGNGLTAASGDGGPATAAGIAPDFLVVASNGDVFVSDGLNHRVRKITAATGIITTIAGTGANGSTGDAGQATAATLMSPEGLALDGSGNLYIADSGASKVRKVANNGTITTYAGTGTAGFNNDNIAASTAQLSSPSGLTIDGSGNLFIADTFNNRIRRVDAVTKFISTVAGTTTGGFDMDGTANAHKLNRPGQIVFANGIIYLTDHSNQRFRRVNLTSNSMTTIAGNGTATSTGDGGLASAATLDLPTGLAVSGSTAYLADGSSTIRAVSGITTPSTATIARFAGIGEPYAGDGGQATAAVVGDFLRFATAPNGDLIIADGVNNRVRRVSSATGTITTIAGTGSSGFNGDGPALTRNLTPNAIAVDPTGNVFIGLDKDALVLKIDASTGMVTTVAGAGDQTFNGDGPALSVNLEPDTLATDAAGNVYIGDHKSARVRKLTVATGIVSTVAGTGVTTYNGDGPVASTNLVPEAITVGSNGDIFVSDRTNLRVRKVSISTEQVTTLIGTGAGTPNGSTGSGVLTNVQPAGIAVDSRGDVYLADDVSNVVRFYDASTHEMSVLAGTGVPGRTGDGGAATAAQLVEPAALALTAAGRLYIGDEDDNRIRVVTGAIPADPTAPSGPSGPSLPTESPVYQPVTPERLLDTRIGTGAPVGKLVAGDRLVLAVTGVGATAVPATAAAVALNVTVTEPDAAGYLTVWPCGQPQPLASNLNFSAGETIPNLVIATLGTAGAVCFSGSATTHIVADVNGWFAPSPTFVGVTPERLLDTRSGIGAPTGALTAGTTLTLQITGAGATAAPANTTAVALNVTVDAPVAPGYLTVWPCDQPRPVASNLNFSAGQTIPNLVLTKLSAAGTVCMVGLSTTQVVADINGYFLPSASSVPAPPERLLDTRAGLGAPVGPLAAGDTLTLQVVGAGATNVPTAATAAVLNVTVTDPAASGYLTVWPCDASRPVASNLNYAAGQTIPNLVIAKLSAAGTVCIAGLATTQIVADVSGWFS